MMLVTENTRVALAVRRERKRLEKDGYWSISESGDPLWKFHRGAWQGKHIEHVVIGFDGKTLFIRPSS